jgi:predicted DCC family thiol-disulfide oxidoreductase YuxK
MNGTVLFDGNCNLCDRLAVFLRKHDRFNRFRLVPLQSVEGMVTMLAAGLNIAEKDTALYSKENRFYLRSSAVLHILKDLGGAWRILYIFIIVPPIIRDHVYRFFARNRYRIFGRTAGLQDCKTIK